MTQAHVPIPVLAAHHASRKSVWRMSIVRDDARKYFGGMLYETMIEIDGDLEHDTLERFDTDEELYDYIRLMGGAT